MGRLSVYNQSGDNMHVTSNHLAYVEASRFPVIAMNNNKVEAYNTAGRDVTGTWMGYVLIKNRMKF